MSCKRGFSLVELVVVILILGILAPIAAPKLFNAFADAKGFLISNVDVLVYVAIAK